MFPLDLFENPFVIYPVVLMESLEYLNHGAMRSRLYLEALPTLSMFVFVSTDLTKDYFGCVLSRIMKAECCLQCGFFSESVALFLQIILGKGLPNFSIRPETFELELDSEAAAAAANA